MGEILAPERSRRREVVGIVTAAATILLSLALWSYDRSSDSNLVGPVGIGLASLMVSAFGVAAWVLDLDRLGVIIGLHESGGL